MVRRPNVICCRLDTKELREFHELCVRNNLRYQDMLRAIVVDALAEERCNALRRQQSEGREGSGETSKTCGAATS